MKNSRSNQRAFASTTQHHTNGQMQAERPPSLPDHLHTRQNDKERQQRDQRQVIQQIEEKNEIVLKLEQLKAIWQSNPADSRIRVLQTTHLIFNLSQRLGLLGNETRIQLKDSFFCIDLIDIIIHQTPTNVEQKLQSIIAPLLRCINENDLKQTLQSRHALDAASCGTEAIEAVCLRLIAFFKTTETTQLARLEQIRQHLDLLIFAIGQIYQNLPMNTLSECK